MSVPLLPLTDAGTRVLGDYEIQASVGRGAHGEVFRARHLPSGAIVALKVLHASLLEQTHVLKREFRMVADIVHPNLVLPRSLEPVDDQLLITMELVTGVGVLDYLARFSGEQRLQRIRALFMQLASALV
jgi:eukaryotic-like serine/threonine-protein kinase